jgi:hypothetical protein
MLFRLLGHLVDACDAAQKRGEVRTRADNQHVPDQNKLSPEDIGLTRKDIHEARQFRDAEVAQTGIARPCFGERSRRAAFDGNHYLLSELTRARLSMDAHCREFGPCGLNHVSSRYRCF